MLGSQQRCVAKIAKTCSMLKEEILQQMHSIDVPIEDEHQRHDEGIPSKAIWDPSLSMSSSSSVASTSSESSTNHNDTNTNKNSNATAATATATNNSRVEDAVVDPVSFVTSTEATAIQEPPYAAPTESNISMRMYHEEQDEHDDNRMSSMFSNSITSAHGPTIRNSSSSRKNSQNREEEKKNDAIFGSLPQDERHRFIHSLSHLSDKQLRTQLWDGFRLARVILGKPIKDKRKLSHKSILHAIRKVAESKIQIIRMAEELDGYRQKEKKQLRLLQKQQQTRKLRPPTPGKENGLPTSSSGQQQEAQQPQHVDKQLQHQQRADDSLSMSSSSLFTFASSSNDGPSSVASVRDVISDSDSPQHAMTKLREEAIKVLQDESDLALSQIQELEDQKQHKRKRRLDENGNTTTKPSLLVSPTASAASVESDDFSFGSPTHESAADILHAFSGGKRSPLEEEETLSNTMRSDGTDRANANDNSNKDKDENGNVDGHVDVELDDGVEEIRRVLQRVLAFENEQPEITITTNNNPSLVTKVHEEVISLLTRLAQNPPPPPVPTKMPSNDPETEVEVEVEAQQQSGPVAVVVNKTVSSGEADSDEESPPSAEIPSKEPVTEAQQKQQSSLVVVDEEEDDEVAAECRAQLSAAKKLETNSIENFDHLKLQKELLDGDIVLAKKNTTQNRTKLQLQRLEGYKKQLTRLLEQEEDRAKQIETLDSELNHLATVCVTLEDSEAEFREKHERHQTALGNFRELTNNHTEKFRSLLGSIERGIAEQSTIVLGEDEKKRKKKDYSGDDDELKSLPSGGSGSYEESNDDVDASYSARKIQKLEYLLIKQNVELFTAKAKLKAAELKPNKKSSRIKGGT